MIFQNSFRKSAFDCYLFAICVAVELLMSFTFWGYLHFPPMSVTIAYIPILIAGCCFGVPQATFTGFVFGLASMYKASTPYVLATDMVFSPFYSGKPLGSLFLSIGTRTLYGLLIGLAYAWAKTKLRRPFWGICLISAAAPLLHTFSVFATYGLFFPELGYTWRNTFDSKWGHLFLALFCMCVTGLNWKFYSGKRIARLRISVNRAGNLPHTEKRMTKPVILFGSFMVIVTVSAAGYFTDRTAYMLGTHDITVSSAISYDLMHLQIEFMFAILALHFITVMMLFILSKQMAYRSFISDLDDLTGVMGRRMFYDCLDKQKARGKDEILSQSGWLLLADVDYFKTINDTFGHPTGDKVLVDFAAALNGEFGENGVVGRVGGDEFAVLLKKPLTEEELKQKLEHFKKTISGILSQPYVVTASIGGCVFSDLQNRDKLMEKADAALYAAKKNGRDGYVLKAFNEN